jgi:hypothetical protein
MNELHTDILYITGGIACVVLGAFIVARQIDIFRSGQQDALGYDIKLFTGGVGFVIVGLIMIVQHT